jgi:hypothetical protein
MTLLLKFIKIKSSGINTYIEEYKLWGYKKNWGNVLGHLSGQMIFEYELKT